VIVSPFLGPEIDAALISEPFNFFHFLGLCCHLVRLDFTIRVLSGALKVDPFGDGRVITPPYPEAP